ncbi:hypothetical protein COY05_04375 [Candidatus Peregrinibacteria bacterium CG_4_10_14_0_2_um_filter_38_24]|nr:MAG: hypothetical protein COY05_04375 [Candidatus Peregrinibacteria bacterium CG_4_10_14_0_2_um_filter_38_24]PJC39232.1 MAG: hypothetical protein CO044_00775 [Candidatus Peregrinibacteria bacterium CG_4_9_14_0_2_um_filter_38_9]
MEADYSKIKLHSLFDPIKKIFEFFILGTIFIGQKDFQALILEQNKELRSLIEKYNKEVKLRVEGTRVKSNTKMYYTNISRLMAIAIFDILQCSKYHNAVKNSTVFKFAKHIRNGAAHDNTFDLAPPIKNPITWQKFTITQSLNKTPVFPDFIGAPTLIFLMKDISEMIEKHEEEKNRHHSI